MRLCRQLLHRMPSGCWGRGIDVRRSESLTLWPRCAHAPTPGCRVQPCRRHCGQPAHASAPAIPRGASCGAAAAAHRRASAAPCGSHSFVPALARAGTRGEGAGCCDMLSLAAAAGAGAQAVTTTGCQQSVITLHLLPLPRPLSQVQVVPAKKKVVDDYVIILACVLGGLLVLPLVAWVARRAWLARQHRKVGWMREAWGGAETPGPRQRACLLAAFATPHPQEWRCCHMRCSHAAHADSNAHPSTHAHRPTPPPSARWWEAPQALAPPSAAAWPSAIQLSSRCRMWTRMPPPSAAPER